VSVSFEPTKLDCELAQPAAAYDHRACPSAQPLAHATDRAIRSNPRIGQWCSLNGIEAHQWEDVAFRWNSDPFGVAAVRGPAGFDGIRARLFLARQTEMAFAAPPTCVDEDRSDARHLPGDLMAEHQRQPKVGPPFGRQVDIRVADTGAAYTHDHGVARFRPLLQ
jgi:hypothetical protein